MTEKNSGPQEGIKGAVEDVKGKAKEAVGTVTGRDDMVREGKAQQDKADAEQDVAKKEAVRVILREVPKSHWAAGDETLAERAANQQKS